MLTMKKKKKYWKLWMKRRNDDNAWRKRKNNEEKDEKEEMPICKHAINNGDKEELKMVNKKRNEKKEKCQCVKS